MCDDLCGSDHYPVFIRSLDITSEVSTKKFNYFRADWSLFSKLATNVPSYETKLAEFNLQLDENHVFDAAAKSILFSVNFKIKYPAPYWNDECRQAKRVHNKANSKFKGSDSDCRIQKTVCHSSMHI